MKSALALLLFCATAQAQGQIEVEDEPAPAMMLPSIPDASFRAVGTRTVIVRTRSGELVGQILAVEPATVTLSLESTRQVVTLARAEVVGLCLLTPPEQPLLAVPQVVEQSRRPLVKARHVSLGLGLTPGLSIDADVGLFYAFGNASLVFPAATSGQLTAFTTGLGLNFPFARGSNWKFEVYGYIAPATFDRDWVVGLGVGIGVHYTNPSGFTLGFKAPILGYGFQKPVGYDDSSLGNAVSTFYLASAMGLPLVHLGYRF